MHYKYKLGLTDAQIKTMKKLDVDFKKKIIQAKADHEMAHLELDLQVHSGEVDEGKIRAAGAKIVASKTDKIMAMIEAKIQLLKLLTAEQRQKMAKIPVGAELIDNPVSAAPGFNIENVFVFAGVPKIMQSMFFSIKDKFFLKKVYHLTTHLYSSFSIRKRVFSYIFIR